MVVLAQAKNGDKQFWKSKFHAANGKAQHALDFFSFKFFLGRGKDFSFFLCSQNVPFKFPMSSYQVPNMFPRFTLCSPRVFPIAPGFNPLCFAQSPPLPHLYRWAKGETLHLSIESSILGGLHSFNFFW